MTNITDLKKLFDEFPKDAVSWRAQTLTKDGAKAMALAYIDARDVMERLDEVCGSDGWQDRYEFSGARTICYLSVKVGDEWITKADGAGDTAVEAEKGAISDAFKRAAVKWGIGRYLYALDAPWVPCEVSEWNGKKQWKSWKDDPWKYVKGAPKPTSAEMKRKMTEIDQDLIDCHSIAEVNKCAKVWAAIMQRDNWPQDFIETATPKFAKRREALSAKPEDDIANQLGGRIVNERIQSTLEAGE